MSEKRPPGTDTPTGTDPEAPYEEPGFEDKSLGQAAPAREKQGRPETGPADG